MQDEAGKEKPMPRFPTPLLSEAIRRRSGPLYHAVVEVVSELNSELSPDEIAEGLEDFLGPRTPQEVFDPPTRIRLFPSGVIVDGIPVQVLEEHPLAYLNCLTSVGALRKAVWQRFGGPEGYAKVRAAYVSEGGQAKDFDNHFVGEMRKARDDSIERARLQAAKADAADPRSSAKRSGCATRIGLFGLGILALWEFAR